MTSSDFDIIISRSFFHETKQSFLLEEMTHSHCIPFEYARGLINAFKRIEEKFCEVDYFLDEDGILGTYHTDEIPFCYQQDFYEGEKGVITRESLVILWPELKNHLLYIIYRIENEKSYGFEEQISFLKKSIYEIDNEIKFSIVQNNKTEIKESDGGLIKLNPENGKEISEIREYICEKIETIDADLKWKYVFLNRKDYVFFQDILINYFLDESFTIPTNKKIILKEKCKTRLSPVFNTIHKKFTNGRTPNLKKDMKYYDLIKIFSHYKTLDYNKIKKDITREKQIL